MRKAAMAKGVQFVEQPVTELRMLLGIVTSRWFKGHESQELYLLPKINPPGPMVKQGVQFLDSFFLTETN